MDQGGRRLALNRVPRFVMLRQMESPKQKESRAEYLARWEAVEIFKAHELAAMTDERARQIIRSLGAPEGWRERPDWSGLVEQQAIFHKKRA
jgi:hypothetical protein